VRTGTGFYRCLPASVQMLGSTERATLSPKTPLLPPAHNLKLNWIREYSLTNAYTVLMSRDSPLHLHSRIPSKIQDRKTTRQQFSSIPLTQGYFHENPTTWLAIATILSQRNMMLPQPRLLSWHR
jgi:arginine deiminase